MVFYNLIHRIIPRECDYKYSSLTPFVLQIGLLQGNFCIKIVTFFEPSLAFLMWLSKTSYVTPNITS